MKIVIESESFDELKREMKKMIKDAVAEILASKNMDDQNEWITFEKAKAILPYKSKTTWQKLRDKREIEFFQDRGLILYSRNSLLEYIKKTYC